LYKLCAALTARGLGSAETWQACGKSAVAYAQQSIMAAVGAERGDLLRRNLELMDGLALAIVISAKYPSSRILLFTGDMASAELLVSGRKSDREFQIMSKPIHPTVLLETAKRLLA
jgi:hypothetical protein